MVRYAFVPCLLIAALLAPSLSHAQDRTTQDRLDRLERDLNMLQRQVYRGPPTSGAAPGGGSTNAADVEIRMERLEAQMRDLTGRVEEVANSVDTLKQRIEQINSDFSVRFDQMSGGTASASPPPPPGRAGAAAAASSPSRLAAGPTPPPAGLMPPGTVVPGPSAGGGLNPIFNTLSPPGSAPAGPPPAALGAEPASTEPPLPRGSPTEQFNHAFGLIKQGDYPGAETAFRAFIEAHPNDALSGNAQYWLGQTYFRRNKFGEAATAFAEGYKRAPKGEKAPEDLLYLGISLAKADQKKSACVAFAQLDQSFPNAGAAVKERATAEKRRLACG